MPHSSSHTKGSSKRCARLNLSKNPTPVILPRIRHQHRLCWLEFLVMPDLQQDCTLVQFVSDHKRSHEWYSYRGPDIRMRWANTSKHNDCSRLTLATTNLILSLFYKWFSQLKRLSCQSYCLTASYFSHIFYSWFVTFKVVSVILRIPFGSPRYRPIRSYWSSF